MSLVRLHARDARAVSLGHPWVYRQAVAERPRHLRSGDVVDVGTPEHDFIGRGVWDPSASVAVRIWTRDRGERIDSALVARRVRAAAAVRERSGIASRTNAYRVVNAEGDFLPGVVVERWDDFLTVTLHGDAVRALAPTICDGIEAALPARGICIRDDDSAHHVSGEPLPSEMTVREPTGTFLVRPGEPGKVGLFTDMRDVRVALGPRVAGRSFLNLFAHTGAFSAAAAAAGAATVTSVDLSKPYLDVARRNVAANAPDARHECVAGDAFEVLRGFATARRRFDVVLADPPTFSSSKSSGTFNVRDGYKSLARACLRVLEPGGTFVAATNFRGISTDEFLRSLHDAAEAERADLRVLDVMGQPADYASLALVPETRHLHVAFCSAAPSHGAD